MERPLSYLQVEQTLARVLAIRPEHIASLRARPVSSPAPRGGAGEARARPGRCLLAPRCPEVDVVFGARSSRVRAIELAPGSGEQVLGRAVARCCSGPRKSFWAIGTSFYSPR